MRTTSAAVLLLLFVLPGCAPQAAEGPLGDQRSPQADSMADAIERRAAATAHALLADESDPAVSGAPTFEAPGRVPHYLRVLAALPEAPEAFGAAFRAMLLDGTVAAETKAAMGLRIGHDLQSPYIVAHMRRILEATERGRGLRGHVEASAVARPAERAAIEYASWLTADVHGVDDERFGQVRAHYTDPQLVELTMVVSFFNYFTRLVEATGLPVERWALDTPAAVSAMPGDRRSARIGMLTDEQIRWAAGTVAARPEQAPGAELGIVNSQRAMNLVPDITTAWRAFTATISRDAVVDRELRLHVSFAVSMANGCRYCTLHQVQGLRRLGVSADKLLRMQKDDGALTPRELAAVTFARKLTAAPSSVTGEDYEAVRAEFGDRGALEVVLQTANFAFMNRFTDNLGLPSEDEAIQIYREVYGADWE